MQVHELITLLEQYDPNMPVLLEADNMWERQTIAAVESSGGAVFLLKGED